MTPDIRASWQRRKRATEAKRAEATAVLPRSLVMDALRALGFIGEMSVTHEQVYETMVRALTAAESSPKSDSTPSARAWETMPQCAHCGVGQMYAEDLPSEGGMVVCGRCGCVGSVWMLAEDPTASAMFYLEALLRSADDASLRRRQARVQELMFHYAPYAKLSRSETLECIQRADSRGYEPGRRAEAIVAAEIALHKLELPQRDALLQRIRSCESSEPVELRPPAIVPTFPCAECGKMCFNTRTARFHCREYGKRRRR